MDVRINQGYVITDSCHVGNSEFVRGFIQQHPSSLLPGNAIIRQITIGVTISAPCLMHRKI